MPELDGKKSLRVGGNVVYRTRAPSSPATVARQTQFIVDYKTLKAHIPDSKPDALIEATQGSPGRHSKFQATNRNGRSAALGPLYYANLGATPDDPGKF